MPQPRTCPHCLGTLGIEEGFHYTKELVMVCDHCGKNVFPTDWVSESPIETAVKARTPTPASTFYQAPAATTTTAPAGSGVRKYPPGPHGQGFNHDFME